MIRDTQTEDAMRQFQNMPCREANMPPKVEIAYNTTKTTNRTDTNFNNKRHELHNITEQRSDIDTTEVCNIDDKRNFRRIASGNN